METRRRDGSAEDVTEEQHQHHRLHTREEKQLRGSSDPQKVPLHDADDAADGQGGSHERGR
ncbi:MAG TPA: hypothetical protein VLL25_12800 [Acidimicrobiales bacterium]|nr:hypothetical protein [Acidimicrobiales bacterium]